MKSKHHLQQTIEENRKPTHNMGFAKKRASWLIEHPASHQLSCYIDNFEFRNPLLRKALNRYAAL